MALWSRTLSVTTSCLSPLPKFEYRSGHVRRLPVTQVKVDGPKRARYNRPAAGPFGHGPVTGLCRARFRSIIISTFQKKK